MIARCTQVVVDSLPQAQKLSRELRDFFGPPEDERWKRVRSLAEAVAAGQSRSPADDLTLFKSLGMGISDLALGMELYQKALVLKLGREFAHPERVAPRLRANRKQSSGELGG